MKLYEILIRVHPDGQIGACAYKYQVDGVTPDPNPIPLDTRDFPQEARDTVQQIMGEFASEIISDNTRLRRERDSNAAHAAKLLAESEAAAQSTLVPLKNLAALREAQANVRAAFKLEDQ